MADTSSWDWEEVRQFLVESYERNATNPKNAVEVLSITRLDSPWDVNISFVNRRDGRHHEETFDLLHCVTAYDAIDVNQLAGMVYSDLEESVLSAP